MVGLGDDSQMHSRATQIASIDPLSLPLSRTMRFRDTNIETIGLVNPPSDFDGVLTDAAGNVLGMWSSFAYDSDNGIAQALRGVPIDLVADMVDRVRSGRPLHSLDAELDPEPLASARQMGLSAEWTTKLAAHSPTERQVLTVMRMVGGSPASSLLQPGDLLLALDGKVVTEFREVEQATADHDRSAGDGLERRRRADAHRADGDTVRCGARERRAMGGRDAAGALPSDARAAWHSSRWRLRRLLRIRLARGALRALPGPADRAGRWPADARSRRVPEGGCRDEPDRSSLD